jgi:transcriptional regulator with XRE-family HTH domain
VDRVKIGSTSHAIRLELHLRQADVALRAGVSQQAVSSIERGLLGPRSVDALDRVAEALQADLSVTVRWRGPKLARLLDRRHAHLQNQVVAALGASGWTAIPEEPFNHCGDRGSVDILAWRPDARALLIVEIKTEIVDLQDLLRTLEMKARVVPSLVPRSHGWRPAHVAVVVVLPSTNTHRRAVATYAALLGASLPARTREVRAWLEQPRGALHGIWFFPCTPGESAIGQLRATRRVRQGRAGPGRSKAAESADRGLAKRGFVPRTAPGLPETSPADTPAPVGRLA